MLRIDIPDKRPSSPAYAAAGILIEVLRQEGVDPRKAAGNQPMREVCVAWSRGEMDEAGFRRSCRNMLILNSGLAAT